MTTQEIIVYTQAWHETLAVAFVAGVLMGALIFIIQTWYYS